MKKSETKLINNKTKFLNKYFEFFKNSENIISEFDINDSGVDFISFKKNIRDLYPIKACGKHTNIFWVMRGYDLLEANELRVPYKIKKEPSHSPMNKEFWIKKGMNIKEAEYKIRTFRKMNPEYWEVRGYNSENAKINAREFQKNSTKEFQKKRKISPEKYQDIYPNQVKYWTKRGYSLGDATKKVSDIQITFSKEICIEKHGLEKGIAIWSERQEKWLNSMGKSNYNGIDGKGKSLNRKIEEYDKEKLIGSLCFRNKEEVYDIISKCEDIKEVVDYYITELKKENDILLYKSLKPFILQKQFFIKYYNTTQDEILSLVIPKLSFIPTKWGNIRWYNNHICRSDGEYLISKFLHKSDIEYVYEKYYNKDINKMKTDFYLTELDYYIEYTGMRNNKYTHKKTFLNENNITNVYFSSDIEDIKKFIIKLNDEYNNR